MVARLYDCFELVLVKRISVRLLLKSIRKTKCTLTDLPHCCPLIYQLERFCCVREGACLSVTKVFDFDLLGVLPLIRILLLRFLRPKAWHTPIQRVVRACSIWFKVFEELFIPFCTHWVVIHIYGGTGWFLGWTLFLSRIFVKFIKAQARQVLIEDWLLQSYRRRLVSKHVVHQYLSIVCDCAWSVDSTC